MRQALILIMIFLTHPLFASETGWEIVDKKETYITEGPLTYPNETHIKFKNGKEFNTNVIELELLAILFTEEKIPFLLFSGRDCTECDANTSIYIHSPLAGFLDASAGKNSYSYPGKLYYYINNSLLSDDRLFYGNCLHKEKKNVVWYSKYFGNDNKWHQSVYVVEFVGNTRKKSKEQIDYANIEKTLSYLNKGICKEIPGTEMTSEP